jgi:voltage-gated potassium channel
MLTALVFVVVLAALSALLHALGLLALLYWQTKQWPRIEADFRPRRNLPVFLFLFFVILSLHLLEISLWACAYFWRGGIPHFVTALYFSTASYTTVGYGDVLPLGSWCLVGALESLTGVLLLGWSAAFFFSVVSRFFQIRIQHWQRKGAR